MTVEERTCRIGIVEMDQVGLFLLERLCLHPQARLAGLYDPHPKHREWAAEFNCPYWDQPNSAIESVDADILYFGDRPSDNLVSQAIRAGKQIVVGQPWLLSSAQLESLSQLAASNHRLATFVCQRRWSADFLDAMAAKETNRLGALRRVHMSSWEMGLSASVPSAGVVREFGFLWLDQLLRLNESAPERVFAKTFQELERANEHGVLTTIQFADGCVAQVEIQTQSRLSQRTGWMLEGTTGSYRGRRIYTVSASGEVVDEPLVRTEISPDGFMGELIFANCGRPTRLPNLIEAARVVRLIECIEESAISGEVVEYCEPGILK